MRRGWADDLRKAREKQSKKPKEEEEEDCVILDGDPNKPLEVKNELENESDELVVVAEKGQIACRDYPHARHLCVTFPFNTNPHEKYCDLCHCYVCDTLAPCVYWVWGTDKSSDEHCHATDKEEIWRELRQRSKEGKLAQLQVSGLLETTLSNEPLCHQAVNCSQPLNVNEETQLQVSGLLETTLSSEPLRHQALNCSQPLNVNEERVVQLELMSLALDRSTVQGDRLTGIVKWFDSHKGYGFISPEDGCEDLFVHHSSIKSKGHQSLAEGERVEFEIEIDDHGRGKATNVSGPGGSFVPGTSGRDNCGIDFSMRGGRGPGDRIYGGRASASRRGYGRNKDTGASSLGGSIFQGITRKDNYGISDSDASRCYKCGEMGHLARNCNGIGGGIGNSDSDASRCYKCGEMGHLARNCNGIGGGISNSDSDASACYKCGEMGHLARNCNGIGGGIGNSDSDASGCYKCGEMGHLARNCNGLGGGIGNNFRVRVDRGGGRKGYGSRASVSYRGGDSGRNRAAGVSSPGGSFLQETTSSNTGSDTPKCYNCGEIGHLTRNCDDGGGGRDNGLNGSVHRVRVDRGGGRISAYRRGDLERNKAVGVSSVDRFDNLLREREIFACFKCGELGHSSRDCDVGGGSNGFNRGGGRKDYGSRASVSYRGGNSGRNRAAGVRSPGGSFLQETTSSNRDSDTPKCYNCGEIGHLTRNCDGGGGGRDNGLNGSVHRVRVDRGGGRISAHRRGDLERNKAVGVSSVDRLDNWLREMENFPCLKCGELGHSSRDCDVGGGSNGFNRGYTVGSYNRSDNRQRGGCDGGTNSGRSGSFELSNSRYNERNRKVSMRRPNGNLPRGNTRRDDHYGEIGNSTRDRPSMERGSGGCYICGKLGHQARDCYKERGGGRSEDGVSSCTCGEAGHLPDCPKKQDGGSGAEVPCFTCHEPGHLPIDCPKKHQIWRELHFGF